jgi:hypothetical protein
MVHFTNERSERTFQLFQHSSTQLHCDVMKKKIVICLLKVKVSRELHKKECKKNSKSHHIQFSLLALRLKLILNEFHINTTIDEKK